MGSLAKQEDHKFIFQQLPVISIFEEEIIFTFIEVTANTL